MKVFIKKHQYNSIEKCLFELNNAFRNCIDIKVIETTKAYTQEKILNIFENLSIEQKKLLDISKITDSLHIDNYLNTLDEYVYGMPNITNDQIIKLFKKEKKLKLPPKSAQDSKIVYLGWIDPSIKKLFIVYNLEDKFVGMACKIQNSKPSNNNICVLCNHIGPGNEVAFVSPICKTSNAGPDAYKSIGFYICLDSAKCNEQIVSVEKLEELLKKVNNIK
ncbi:FusB/FusC family EF-G-binding protein [Clostridium sp. DL1XJH146]